MSELRLPDTTPNGHARAHALARDRRPDVAPTSLVSFLSRGRVLVVGEETTAVAVARRLDESLTPTVLSLATSGAPPAAGSIEGIGFLRAAEAELSGALGNFRLRLTEPTGADESIAAAAIEEARFDLVLDLGETPLLRAEAPPPGYYAPRGDSQALEHAIAELPEMRGEFEKPKYFNYDPEICAHGRRGKRGCTRCLEVCPAWAITSIGERVSVDPNLCQGFGSCAAVCPTGAISYAFPSTGDLLAHLRGALKAYSDAGGGDPLLLFFDDASAGRLEEGGFSELPENVLPVELEEVGSAGMDVWLACLAYGARRVLILTGTHTPESIRNVFRRETAVAAAILEGMGYPGTAVQIVDADDDEALGMMARPEQVLGQVRPARFQPPPEKSLLLRTAINHLLEYAPSHRKSVTLPQGAAFGQVKVDRNACTLCMSCVAVCPTSALREGQGLPQLGFVERSCIQCGLCETACPEDAVSLEARFLYDDEERSTRRLLHEEQPACCISCGKPFATRSMLKAMAQKLENHWMFQAEADRRRLQMCDECRVKDLMRARTTGGKDST